MLAASSATLRLRVLGAIECAVEGRDSRASAGRGGSGGGVGSRDASELVDALRENLLMMLSVGLAKSCDSTAAASAFAGAWLLLFCVVGRGELRPSAVGVWGSALPVSSIKKAVVVVVMVAAGGHGAARPCSVGSCAVAVLLLLPPPPLLFLHGLARRSRCGRRLSRQRMPLGPTINDVAHTRYLFTSSTTTTVTHRLPWPY